MGVLENVIAAFGTILVIQIVLFRFINPKSPFRWIAVIFSFGAIATLVLRIGDWSLARSVHFTLFYFSLLGVYVMTFLNTREPGPSFLMLRSLEAQKSVRRADFDRIVSTETIWSHRLEEMVKSGIVIKSGDSYSITPYGRRYLFFYTAYRRLLGIRERGG